jgi:hypothetical protein
MRIAIVIAGLLATAPVSFSKAKPDTITFQFTDAKACDVIREIAVLFEVSVEIPDDLCNRRVSGKLFDAGWRDIFTEALNGTGYTFIEGKDRVRVLKISQFEPPYTESAIIGNWVYRETESSMPCIGTTSYRGDGTYVEELILIGSGKGRFPDLTVTITGLWKLDGSVLLLETKESSRPNFIQYRL